MASYAPGVKVLDGLGHALDPVDALAATVIFAEVPRAELAALAPTLRTRSFARREIVWTQGDRADGLYILRAGRALVSRIDEDGNEVVIQVMVPGTSDGEPSLFVAEQTRATDARTITEAEFLIIERDRLLATLERQPIAMRGMLRRLSQLVRGQTSQLSHVAFQDIARRLAQTLLELARARGVPGPDGVRIALPLTQRTLAGLVAASRENVNRALAKLSAEGLVRFEDGLVTVLDEERLGQRAAG
jgi:CRP-like cAMP-binding protein